MDLLEFVMRLDIKYNSTLKSMMLFKTGMDTL